MMPKISLLQVDENSPLISALASMFHSKWSDFKESDLGILNPEVPLPIAAVSDGQLVGGLAFSLFEEPGCTHKVVWLNAVYVRCDFRGQGIASQLIRYAQRQLTPSKSGLYAYTNVPALYQSLGWSEVDTESEPNHKVMRIS
ncbi:GNAT family N-acetyltransferase [Vibrio qingdaonensis]